MKIIIKNIIVNRKIVNIIINNLSIDRQKNNEKIDNRCKIGNAFKLLLQVLYWPF